MYFPYSQEGFQVAHRGSSKTAKRKRLNRKIILMRAKRSSEFVTYFPCEHKRNESIFIYYQEQ